MLLPRQRISDLLSRYTNGIASAEEERELFQYLLNAEEDDALKSFMKKEWDQQVALPEVDKVDWESMYARIIKGERLEKTAPVVSFKGSIPWWRRPVAAAVLLILISIGAYFYFSREHKAPLIVQHIPSQDVNAPLNSKAKLTLSDGTVIELDEQNAGTVAMQDKVAVEKTADGKLVYKGDAGESRLNVLTVPKGSKPVHLVLADGSNVWVNVASSITYPASFNGNQRKVSITGEAYFEIAPNAEKPFIVAKNNVEVKVLGTRFNVNAYDDENEMRITLIEGKVNVKNGSLAKNLLPNQEAKIIAGSAEDIEVKNVNAQDAMAWINGLFSFDKMDLHGVMRQLSRWYNVEVEYTGAVPDKVFGGDIERNLTLSQVLKILEQSEVHFKIENQKIIVMP